MRILAVALAAAALGAGCGSAASSESESRAAVQRPANSRVHRDAEAEFSIVVPKGWRVIDRLHPAGTELLEAYRDQDPLFAVALERMNAPDSPFYLFAYDHRPRSDFGATMNVLSVRIPDRSAYEEFERGALDTVATLSTRGKPEITREAFATGDVLKVSYFHDPPVGSSCTCLAVTQYVLHGNGRAYILTFSTAADRGARYAPVFERTARSFRLSTAPEFSPA